MHWPVLIFSGLLEALWAIALDQSSGFTRLGPSVLFVLALGASMAGLAYALRGLPLGMSYAVWVGIGAGVTAVYSMSTGQESVSALRVLLVLGIVGCAVGLRFAPE